MIGGHSHKFNFSLLYNKEIWQASYPDEIVRDIEYLYLNHTIPIAFLGVLPITDWPPHSDFNAISEDDFKIMTIIGHRFSIAINKEDTITTKIIPSGHIAKYYDRTQPSIVFFVNRQTYKQYQNELEEVWNSGIEQAFLRNHENLSVIKFILNEIVNSELLTLEELKSLGRKRDNNGMVVPIDC